MNRSLKVMIKKTLQSQAKGYGWLCLPMLLLVFSSCSSDGRLPAQDLVVDNIGYKPNAQKVAFIRGAGQPSDSFKVVNSKTSKTVYRGDINASLKKSPITGDVVHRLNFSEFSEPGIYRIELFDMDEVSPQFRISKDIYNDVLTRTIRSFYYQRCGTEVGIGTKWHHSVCHLDDAALYSDVDSRKDVTGGWHDAGDYGKFSVNTAVSLSFLLYMYDHKPQVFADGQFNIPNDDNGIPDLLDEGRWALDWLLKMQRSDGAVYHKVQKQKWTGEYLPQNDPDRRFIYEVSSTATADFAAVTALAARIYKPFDKQLSKNLAEASKEAWSFLNDHSEMVPKGGFKNPEGVKGGEYGDHKDADERLWASVELYRLTQKNKYHEYFLDYYKKLGGPGRPPISWKNVSEMGYYSYLDASEQLQDKEAVQFIGSNLKNYADKLVKRIGQNNYNIVLKKGEFYWGSNSVLLGYAFDLVRAYEFTGKSSYREAALDQLHYILGRNPFGITYVTGFGKHSVQQPYHQFSMMRDGPPVPGMVVGGPNNKNQLHDNPLSRYPAKSYEDNKKNYMVNETAINYTAPLVYLAGYFSNMSSPLTSEKSN